LLTDGEMLGESDGLAEGDFDTDGERDGETEGDRLGLLLGLRDGDRFGTLPDGTTLANGHEMDIRLSTLRAMQELPDPKGASVPPDPAGIEGTGRGRIGMARGTRRTAAVAGTIGRRGGTPWRRSKASA
jgi:hypothetical protein